jgi:hypothetical protein
MTMWQLYNSMVAVTDKNSDWDRIEVCVLDESYAAEPILVPVKEVRMEENKICIIIND